MTDTIRVLRVLEYIGNRSNIEDDLANRGVKGSTSRPTNYIINESIIGDYREIVPSILSRKEQAREFIESIIQEGECDEKTNGMTCYKNETIYKIIDDLIDHLKY